MRTLLLLLAPALCLAGCAAYGGNEPLVSAQAPPGTGSTNSASEPQPLNSLPYGAANLSTAPSSYQPDFASITLRAF